MRLFVSALLLAAASAGFAQNQTSAGPPAMQAPVNIAATNGETSLLTIEALKTKALTIAMPQLQANIEAPGQRPVCYSMRSYRFMRGDPSSDATKLKSYSTCEAATEFRMRDAVGSAKPR
jgi:hypothetical protein